ncbi:hypothetical protein ACQ856_29355 (plasmid) [Mycolicibacterium psychrotolerans]|uniref:hypothetical protein n=1 Tax=Mycolicibacterium psychrotolerans TaxID=216929 RepID=UPI003D666362
MHYPAATSLTRNPKHESASGFETLVVDLLPPWRRIRNAISDRDLAWSLAEAAHPFLDEGHRAWVYVAIGAADYIPAIERVISGVGRNWTSLPDVIRAEVGHWLSRLGEFADGQQLQRMIDAASSPVQINAEPEPGPRLAHWPVSP